MNKTEARKPEQNQKTIRINVHLKMSLYITAS